MATAEQLKALLKSYLDEDEGHFFAVAMQVAAGEAKRGHGKLAQELRAIIDEAKKRKSGPLLAGKPVPISRPRGELSTLLAASYPKLRLPDMVLAAPVAERLDRIVREQRQVVKIRAHGLSPRRKLLLVGPPGTGKTMSANVLAGELGLPLFNVRLESLITKYMGETAAKLRLIFDAIAQSRGIYLFDEFDTIGTQRTQANDVGEIRRILNSFLQMIDQDESDSLILAATNHPEILDSALFRRFDDVVEFALPSKADIVKLLQLKLAGFITARVAWQKLAKIAEGQNCAEVVKACEDALKGALIQGKEKVTTTDLAKYLSERSAFRRK